MMIGNQDISSVEKQHSTPWLAFTELKDQKKQKWDFYLRARQHKMGKEKKSWEALLFAWGWGLSPHLGVLVLFLPLAALLVEIA